MRQGRPRPVVGQLQQSRPEEGHPVGVPSALGRLALQMVFGAPVDVCSSTGSAVTVSTGSVSSTSSTTVDWVGSATAVSLASWLSGVRRWRSSCGARRAARPGRETMLCVGRFGRGARPSGDAARAQLRHVVVEPSGSGHGQERVDGGFVVLEFGHRCHGRRGVRDAGDSGNGVAVDRQSWTLAGVMAASAI